MAMGWILTSSLLEKGFVMPVAAQNAYKGCWYYFVCHANYLWRISGTMLELQRGGIKEILKKPQEVDVCAQA